MRKKLLCFATGAVVLSVAVMSVVHFVSAGDKSLFEMNVEALTRSENPSAGRNKQSHSHSCGCRYYDVSGIEHFCTERVVECYGHGNGCTPRSCPNHG